MFITFFYFFSPLFLTLCNDYFTITIRLTRLIKMANMSLCIVNKIYYHIGNDSISSSIR